MLGVGSGSSKSGKIRRLVKNGLQAWYKADQTQAPLGEEEIANGEFATGPELVSNGDFSDGITGWTNPTYNLASQATIEDKGGYVRLSNTPDVQITGVSFSSGSNQVTHDGNTVIDSSYIGRYLRNTAGDDWLSGLPDLTYISAVDPENNIFTIHQNSTGASSSSSETITLTTDWRGKMLRQPLSTLVNGKTYQVKFKVRGNVASNELFVRTIFYSATGEIAASKDITTDWVEHTYYFTAVANSGDISFGLEHWYLNEGTSGSDVNNDWIEIDDVSVKQTDPGDNWGDNDGVDRTWTVEDGKLSHVQGTGDANQCRQTDVIKPGKKYQVNYSIVDYTSGSVRVDLGDANAGTARSAVGDYSEIITNTGTATFVDVEPVAGGPSTFKGAISNISVREITNSVKDCSPNANNGVLYSGKALNFIGTSTPDNYIDIDYWKSKTINANTKAAFAVWFNDDNVSSGDFIFGTNTSASDFFYLGVIGGKLELGWHDKGWQSYETQTGTSPTVVDNTWYRAVAVIDGYTCSVYLNGELAFSKTTTSDFTLHSTGLSIGAQAKHVGEFWDGMLADLQIYDKAWTASDVTYDYNNPDKDVFDDEGRAEVLGEELVNNGDFTNNVTGWTAKDSTISYDNGKLKVSGTENASGGAYQNIGLVTGKHYKMTATIQLLTGSSNGTFSLLTSESGGTGQTTVYTGSALVTSGDAVTETFIFTPGSSDVSIQLSSDESGASYTIDNISVKEVLTHAGEISPTDCTALYRLNEGAGDRVYNAAPVLREDLTKDYDFDDTTWSRLPVPNPSSTTTITNSNTFSTGGDDGIYKTLAIVGSTYKLTIAGTTDASGFKVVDASGGKVYSDISSSGDFNVTVVFTAEAGDNAVGTAAQLYLRNLSAGTTTITTLKLQEISLSDSYVQTSWASSNWITAQPYIPQYAMSSYSKKMIFDGSDDYIELGTDNITIPAADPFSFSFWYYNINESSDQIVLGKDGDSNQLISIEDGNKGIRFKVSSPTDAILDFDNDLTKGKLNHIVLTNAGGSTSNGLKCYVNGVLQSDTEDSLNTDFGFRHICRNVSSYGEGFIDELAHFSKELSATEVQEIFNAGMALDCRDHSAFLGDEEFDDPGFDDPSKWETPERSDGTKWVVSGGKASVDSSGTIEITDTLNGVTAGKMYDISFEISDYSHGAFQFAHNRFHDVETSATIPNVSGNGTYNYRTIAQGSSDFFMYLYAYGASKFSVDNISVKEVDLKGYWRNNGTDVWTDLSPYENNGTVNNTNLLALRSISSNFDSDSASWSNSGGADTFERSTTQKVSGTHSLRIVTDGETDAGAVTANLLTGAEGLVELTVTAKVYPVGITSIETGIDNTSRAKGTAYSNLTAGEWNDISYTCTVTTNANNYLYFLCPESAGQFYLDDVSVVTKPTTIQLQEVPYFKKDTFGLPMNRVRQRGLNLDGDSYVKIDDDSSLGDMDDGFTCSFWYRHSENTTNPNYFALVTKGRGLGTNVDYGFSVSVYNDYLIADINTDTNRFNGEFGIGAASSVGPKWHYITATYNGGNTIKLYTDAVYRDGDTGITGSITSTAEAHPLIVGANYALQPERTRGVIDDVKWYDRVLDIKEIEKNYKATKSRHSSTSSWSDDFSSDFI